ncbi:MAG: DUF523 domain-containing protein [Firmicutes bacterium]|nr:DUF523 domain-containing protein [Bacillota bacterium]
MIRSDEPIFKTGQGFRGAFCSSRKGKAGKEVATIKPTATPVLVSACLLGEKCRYNGKGYILPGFRESLQGYNVIPVCPEVMGGLSVPRPPCEIKGGDGKEVWQGRAGVFTDQGRDLTEAFQEGAWKTLQLAIDTGAKTAILKEQSPSCGCNIIYDGSFGNRLVPGVGVAAALLKAKGIEVLAEMEWLNKRRDNFV